MVRFRGELPELSGVGISGVGRWGGVVCASPTICVGVVWPVAPSGRMVLPREATTCDGVETTGRFSCRAGFGTTSPSATPASAPART